VARRIRRQIPADKTAALMSYLGRNDIDFAEKNRVIWVLGELRDDGALAALRALHGSLDCDHQRLVCQREVRKAISKIEGNMPNPFFWQKIGGV
jgi:hypothetical protein